MKIDKLAPATADEVKAVDHRMLKELFAAPFIDLMQIEYTHNEVMQTQYRIGVMNEIEYRQARTRERWWG